MKKYWYWHEPGVFQVIDEILQKGGIIAGSSDTVTGLLAPLTQEGKKALDRIKHRDNKPYIVLVSDIAKAQQFSKTIADERLQLLLKACWPGPLTVIVPAHKQLPLDLTSEGTIALRVPDHIGLQKVLQNHDGLFSTSANLTGKQVPTDVTTIDPAILNEVAMVIDEQNKKPSKPSTIIDCTGAAIKLIREGAYAKQFLQQYITLMD
jgi:L-threonylcarbamoyladenylate synthase